VSRGYPYRLPEKEVVRPRAWALVTERGDEPLPALLPTWDYGMDLSLRRAVVIDVDRLRNETSVGDAELSLAVYWSAGRLRGAGSIDTLPPTGVVEVELSADLRGWELGGILGLHTVICITREQAAPQGPVAWRLGSTLWSDDKTTKLQGDVPRFPVAVVDLLAQGYPAGAPWILDLQSDLEEPTMGALHLLVNEDDAKVVHAVAAAGTDDEVAKTLLASMHYDAGRTLVDLAVGHEELNEDAEFPAESLGRTLVTLLHRVFPGIPVSAVRDLRNTDPARYSGQIVAALRPSEPTT
jgi:hypothetical protein